MVLIAVCWWNDENLIRLFRDDPEVTAVALPAFHYQCFLPSLPAAGDRSGQHAVQSIGKIRPGHLPGLLPTGRVLYPADPYPAPDVRAAGREICQPIADVLTFVVTVALPLPFLHQLVKWKRRRRRRLDSL